MIQRMSSGRADRKIAERTSRYDASAALPRDRDVVDRSDARDGRILFCNDLAKRIDLGRELRDIVLETADLERSIVKRLRDVGFGAGVTAPGDGDGDEQGGQEGTAAQCAHGSGQVKEMGSVQSKLMMHATGVERFVLACIVADFRCSR